MYKTRGLLFLTVALVYSHSLAFASGAATCIAYAKEAVVKAQAMRQFACGYDVNDPLWATDHNAHAKWCSATRKHAVMSEAWRRRGEIKVCQVCRAYASSAAAAAADNSQFQCGLSGPHWRTNLEAHFEWCMALRNEGNGAGGKERGGSYQSITGKMAQSLQLRTARRMQEIEECKLRKPD